MNAIENERRKKDYARRENNRIEEREMNADAEIELDVDLKFANPSRKNLVVKLRSLLTSSRIWKSYALALVLMWLSDTRYAPPALAMVVLVHAVVKDIALTPLWMLVWAAVALVFVILPPFLMKELLNELIQRTFGMKEDDVSYIDTKAAQPMQPDASDEKSIFAKADLLMIIQIYLFEILESIIMTNISENSLSNLGIESSINNKKLLELFLQSEQENIATDQYHQMSHEDLRDGHYFAKQTLYKYLAVKNEKPLTAEAYYTISKKIK